MIFFKKFLNIMITVLLILLTLTGAVLAYDGEYESESNNTYSTADLVYNSYNGYGAISSASDIDYWKITFPYSGTANFFLGNIPSGCNYNLQILADNGTTVIGSSSQSSNTNELITLTVSKNVQYYVKINSVLGSSTSNYTFTAKVYRSKTITSVPLYEQQTTSTCGPASVRMMLASYGINLSELTIQQKATDIAGPDADYTYVWVLKETLNYYLALNNNATRYKHTNITSYTLTDYERLANDNIEYNHPLQPVLRINSTAYFPYTTSGHYVVIKGMSGNSSSGIYTAVINDPHYDWSNTYNIPISAIFDYNKLHSGYIIHVD